MAGRSEMDQVRVRLTICIQNPACHVAEAALRCFWNTLPVGERQSQDDDIIDNDDMQ